MKLLLIFLFALAAQANQPTPTVPKLFFEYSWLYDANCAVTPERKIDPAWAAEARARTADFEKTWTKSGPVFFGKVFEIFQVGFKRKELTATLSVCPAPSYSNPLVLNVTRYLKSYMGDKPVRSDDSFADLVTHELLHTWLVENFKWRSPLIEKYQAEESTVRNHLHLMAMQKYIYTELERADLLAMIDKQYRNIPSPAYNRAWQIVSDIEGHEAFIAELKND